MKPLAIPVKVGGLILVAALALQLSLIGYLLTTIPRPWQLQVEQIQAQWVNNLSQQFDSALSSGDDLAALSVLQNARQTFPQLQTLMLFQADGKIILHTDPTQIGKATKPYPGPPLLSPERTQRRQGNQRTTQYLVSLPQQNHLCLQISFSEQIAAQSSRAGLVNALLLGLLAAVILGLLAWWLLRQYEFISPTKRSPVTNPGLTAAEEKIRRLIGYSLAEMRQAVVTIDRDNRILSANPPALALLNCQAEALSGKHVLQAPLPAQLQTFYQQAIQTPEHPVEAKMTLSPKAPALPVKLICSPAATDWELALLFLS